MGPHTCARVVHRTVEREVPQKVAERVAERVAGEGLEGRSEVEHKTFLQDDDLMEVGVEEED